jgi:hypothetical protein
MSRKVMQLCSTTTSITSRQASYSKRAGKNVWNSYKKANRQKVAPSPFIRENCKNSVICVWNEVAQQLYKTSACLLQILVNFEKKQMSAYRQY